MVDASGKPLFSPHALRHYAISMFIAQDFAVKWIQAVPGHASASMTLDVYGHLFPDDDEQAKLEREERWALRVVA